MKRGRDLVSLKTDVFLPALLETVPKDGRAQKFKYCQQLVMLKVLLRCELHAVSLSAVTGEKYTFRRHRQTKEPNMTSQKYHVIP